MSLFRDLEIWNRALWNYLCLSREKLFGTEICHSLLLWSYNSYYIVCVLYLSSTRIACIVLFCSTVHSLVVCSRGRWPILLRRQFRPRSNLMLCCNNTWTMIVIHLMLLLQILGFRYFIKKLGLFLITNATASAGMSCLFTLLQWLLVGTRQKCPGSLLGNIVMSPLFSDGLAPFVHDIMNLDHSDTLEAHQTELFSHSLQTALLNPCEQNTHIFEARE